MLLESIFLFSKSAKIACQFSRTTKEPDHRKITAHYPTIIISWLDEEVGEILKLVVEAVVEEAVEEEPTWVRYFLLLLFTQV